MTGVDKLYLAGSRGKAFTAIRNGFAVLLPLIIIQGIVIAVAAALTAFFPNGQAPAFAGDLYDLHEFIISVLPALSVLTISYQAADLYGCNRPYGVVLTFTVFLIFVLAPDRASGRHIDEIAVANNIFSLVLGPLIPWMFGRLASESALHLFRSANYNQAVRRILNYILPTLLILIVAVGASALIEHVAQRIVLPTSILPDSGWTDSLIGLMLYALVVNGLWTVGVHGTIAMGPWVYALNQQASENAVLAQAGAMPQNLGTDSMFHVFVHLGGSGVTMGLIFAVLIASSSRNKRLISASALPIAIFNVNEVVLYGLPVIFNRFMALPFVLAPVLCTVTTYLALSQQWVPIPLTSPGWTAPPLIGAYLATGGSWAAVALAAFNLAVVTALYMPFIRRWERAQNDIGKQVLEYKEYFSVSSLRPELHLQADEQGIPLAPVEDQEDLSRALRTLSRGQLQCYYQPLVDLQTERVVAVETLLRLNDPDRGVLPPTFLPALQRAKLMSEIDHWVIGGVIRDWNGWDTRNGRPPKIHINVSPDTLLESFFLTRLLEAGRMLPLVVEIVEDQLPQNLAGFLDAIETLRSAGIAISLDDFGTGYSSLSRLTQLKISELKIDKSLLDGADATLAGRQLFIGVVALAKRMEMKICAEGVERLEQMQFVREQGVDLIQGYLVGRPMPWSDVQAMIRDPGPVRGMSGRPS